ncbi:alpha/beta fold hydrolase [Halalkalibacterium halodurans]|uniref:alpha/beta fold hydrolase n=1 Tax=Halalkalibacterium halodurans TaxID=86665 RepID=UPI0038B41116
MNIHVKECGDLEAPLLVFLHGGGGSGWMWRNQVDYFRHYHCIVPDLPHHGLSGRETSFTILNSAVALIRLIEKKAQGRDVIVIGFSLGAQILLQMISINPRLLTKAIVNSALVRPIPIPEKLLELSVKSTFPLIKNRWFSRLQAKTLYIGDDLFETYYRESCQMTRDSLMQILKENVSFRLPEKVHETLLEYSQPLGQRKKES